MEWTLANKLTALAIVVAVITLLVSQCNRSEDAEHKKREGRKQQVKDNYDAVPRIVYEKVRYNNGYTYLTFRNASPITPVIIGRFEFVITDPGTLQFIQQRDPKPREYKATAPNTIDDVAFVNGYWQHDGKAYVFTKDVSYHLRTKGNAEGKDVTDLKLGIINRKWAGKKFIGMLEIEFNGEVGDAIMQTYRLNDVTIDGKARP